MRKTIVRFIPRRLKPYLRRLYDFSTIIYHFPAYHVGRLSGLRDPLLPPNWLHSVGGWDFKEVGETFLQYFVNLAGIKPHYRVLDVGSGTGRMALPLTKYLKDGSYEGIDIVAPSVKWCQKTYALRHRNFRFHLSDIYNKEYNPKGKVKASEYKFPFESASFDFVFLTSVFTHMLPEDMENYLSEIARVLTGGGRCLITYFLLNAESLKLIEEKVSFHNFEYELQGCRVERENVPEYAVAYNESAIRSLYGKYGLNILEPVHYGFWCRRKDGLSWQDIIIATKSH
jgi:ubiquinone/menaquinone biosynthesis C-methylase UbiE